MQKTGDAASARSEEMLSTRLETGENRRTVKHNQRKVFTVQPSSSHQVWVLVTRWQVGIDATRWDYLANNPPAASAV